MAGFGQQFLNLKYGVPVSSVLPGLDPSIDAVVGARWFEMGAGWYVMINSGAGTQTDPGVVGFSWVREPRVVDLILRHDDSAPRSDEEFLEPEKSLLGFSPLTYRRALRHEKRSGNRPMLKASYRSRDGQFMYSELATDRRSYHFSRPNPPDDEEAIAVAFRLP